MLWSQLPTASYCFIHNLGSMKSWLIAPYNIRSNQIGIKTTLIVEKICYWFCTIQLCQYNGHRIARKLLDSKSVCHCSGDWMLFSQSWKEFEKRHGKEQNSLKLPAVSCNALYLNTRRQTPRFREDRRVFWGFSLCWLAESLPERRTNRQHQ